MNEVANITGNAGLTMSSLEIAGRTGKMHKHVLADVRKMLAELGLQPAEFSARYIDAKGEPRECYNLPKRETIILVTGYSVQARASIIDRWMELEAAVASATSTTGLVTDLAQEVRAAIGGITKGIIHKELTEIIPKLVEAKLAESSFMIRHGKTAKQIWDAYKLPGGIKSATKWFGNRLQEMGASIADNGRFDRGDTAVRLFDPDKADVFMRNGLLHKAKVYASERMGQKRLRLVSGEGA